MTTRKTDGKARGVLILLILLGISLLAIPFFLTPPAFLEVALRDTVFAANLSGKAVRVVEDASGDALPATVEESGGAFFARVGRIRSGPGAFTLEVEGYQPAAVAVEAAPMERVRATADLIPNFGRVEVSVVNARARQPVSATLKKGGSAVAAQPQSVFQVDLPAGKHLLSAEAAGFCPGEREVAVEPRKVTKVTLPLSPDLTGNEVARIVLDWGENPRDLDAHFLREGTSGYPNPAHVFFQHKTGRNPNGNAFAVLDVDHVNSEGYETVTIFDKAEGNFEYYVHRYAGQGTLGGSAARVEAFTRGCQRRVYSVPAECARNVWEVTHLRIGPGSVEFRDQQKCGDGTPVSLGRKSEP